MTKCKKTIFISKKAKKLISDVNNKIFPFQEKGYDKIIKNYEFHATDDSSIISDSKNIIITVIAFRTIFCILLFIIT